MPVPRANHHDPFRHHSPPVTTPRLGKEQLYRCLDKLVEHKTGLFTHLRERWVAMFDTSTMFCCTI